MRTPGRRCGLKPYSARCWLAECQGAAAISCPSSRNINVVAQLAIRRQDASADGGSVGAAAHAQHARAAKQQGRVAALVKHKRLLHDELTAGDSSSPVTAKRSEAAAAKRYQPLTCSAASAEGAPPVLPGKPGRPRKLEQQVSHAAGAAAGAAAAPPATAASNAAAQAVAKRLMPHHNQYQPALVAATGEPAAGGQVQLLPALALAARQQGPLVRGMRIDLPRMHALLQQQASSVTDLGMPVLWHEAQALVLQQSLRLLVRQLEHMPPPSTDQASIAVHPQAACLSGGVCLWPCLPL